MANEITIQYALPDHPAQARESWKQNPPDWINKGGFKLVDETYDGLVYRGSNAETRFGRMFSAGTYTLSLHFDANGTTGSKVTLTGQVSPTVAAAIKADADANGGGVDPRVGMGFGGT
jgi:hypothetical protein